MIVTPVGVRCKPCAQMRRLPQFDVNLWLLARSGLAGLITSLLSWFIVEYILFVRFFLSIFVGMAVAEVMSRLAKRRTSRLLEAIAVFDVLVGLAAVEAFHVRDYFHLYLTELANEPNLLVSLAIPAAIASFVAIVKLRP